MMRYSEAKAQFPAPESAAAAAAAESTPTLYREALPAPRDSRGRRSRGAAAALDLRPVPSAWREGAAFCPAPPAAPNPRQLFAEVALLGLPNAGKSTLMNALCGSFVSAASAKKRTTKVGTQAVLVDGWRQILLTDLPALTDRTPEGLDQGVSSASAFLLLVDGSKPRDDRLFLRVVKYYAPQLLPALEDPATVFLGGRGDQAFSAASLAADGAAGAVGADGAAGADGATSGPNDLEADADTTGRTTRAVLIFTKKDRAAGVNAEVRLLRRLRAMEAVLRPRRALFSAAAAAGGAAQRRAEPLALQPAAVAAVKDALFALAEPGPWRFRVPGSRGPGNAAVFLPGKASGHHRRGRRGFPSPLPLASLACRVEEAVRAAVFQYAHRDVPHGASVRLAGVDAGRLGGDRGTLRLCAVVSVPHAGMLGALTGVGGRRASCMQRAALRNIRSFRDELPKCRRISLSLTLRARRQGRGAPGRVKDSARS